MKRLLLLLMLLAVTLTASSAADARYTVTSVTDCAQTDSRYDRFYQSGEFSVVIPGLAEGLVPQGIAWMPEEDWLLFAGYRSDQGSSALIAVDRQTGEIMRQASLQYADGRVYNGHAGGVCVTENNIYLSNAHMLYRIPLSAFRGLGEAGVCRFAQEIPVPVNSSYCCYADGVLWVGEFQYTGDYKTDVSHYVKTADGLQRAWTCGYVMGEGQDFARPDYILSVTERIQGVTTLNGRFYLSQSYGRKADSVIYRYENALERQPDDQIDFDGQAVPLWILDSASREDVLICPPMSECLCTVEGGIEVLFESAAQTYMDPKNPSVNPLDRVFHLTGF
ncbi:MAG: hypothetical protein IJ157_01535 [Clostridia bacterium]|nr:hypothetical protein [Clostridia bacterium]